jgi:Xaa-Pro aminopeptidase
MGKFSYWDNLLLPLFQSLSCNARSGLQTPDAIVNVSRIIGEMRLYKSETEIALLRKAAHVSVHAHLQALKEVTRLEYEYQLEAVFLSALGLQGCRNVAYTIPQITNALAKET